MTATQKKILTELFINAGYVKHYRDNLYTLYDKYGNPVKRIRLRTFKRIERFLQQEGNVYLISMTAIRQASMNHFLKKLYYNNKK